ncbi:MAG: NlpC/P60 family protein [Pedobacter sp.]|nr:MAG: NlpC/P60 family protein [Pedobacter sp.]
MIKLKLTFLFVFAFAISANAQKSLTQQYAEKINSVFNSEAKEAATLAPSPATKLLEFASSMIGIRYKYASGNPERGFDCSGFVSYVFHNFGFKVPRSSVEFSRAGKPTTLKQAKVGDVMIFTGSNPRLRKIGHVGIVYEIDGDKIRFIHSTSGKANGVTITNFDGYYKSRFIKVVSIIE